MKYQIEEGEGCLQLLSSKFLQDIARILVEDGKECILGEARDFGYERRYVVDSVRRWELEFGYNLSRVGIGERGSECRV
jgi:hypothetical protein